MIDIRYNVMVDCVILPDAVLRPVRAPANRYLHYINLLEVTILHFLAGDLRRRRKSLRRLGDGGRSDGLPWPALGA